MKRALLVSGLFLLPFIYYWSLFAPDPAERRMFRGDFLNQHYVWKSYALTRIRNGELPLWTPHTFSGAPFHANTQVGLFYPPNYALTAFLSDEGRLDYRALEGLQLLHQGLAGLGMFWLLRALGTASAAAWGGAVVVMFTGFFTTPGHHAFVLTAAWIPMVLFLVGRAMEKPGSRPVALAGLGIALLILAGHPQPAFYGLVLSSAWALYRGGLRGAVRRFLPAAVGGLSLAAIQLLPTYELARLSTRQGAGYEYSSFSSFSPSMLGGMLVPRGQIAFPGQDGSAPLFAYVGVGTLILAAVGVAASRRRARWFFAAVAVLSLLLAIGEDSFLYDVAYLTLPGFARFRIPFRLFGLYAIGMAALAALGLEVLMPIRKLVSKRVRTVLLACLGLLLVLGAWTAYLHFGLQASPGTTPPAGMERLIAGANWAVLLLLLNTLLLCAGLWRRGSLWPAAAMIGLLLIDVGSFVHDRGMHPYRTLVRSEERRVDRLMAAQRPRGRYTHPRPLSSYSMLHGTEFAGGQDSLVNRHYISLLALGGRSTNVLGLLNVKLIDRGLPAGQNAWCGPRVKSPLPLLDVTAPVSPIPLELREAIEVGKLLLTWTPLGPGGEAHVQIGNVGHTLQQGTPLNLTFHPPLSLSELEIRVEEGNPGVRLVDLELDGRSVGEIFDSIGLGDRIRLNLRCLPRAYFLGHCTRAEGESALDVLSCWSLEDGVVLPECTDHARAPASAILHEVSILRYEPEEVELQVVAPADGYVVLADAYHPGWRAEVDSTPVPLLRAQHALRAVAVTAGPHTIRFSYRPRSFTIGLTVSLLAAVSLLAGAAWKGRPGN